MGSVSALQKLIFRPRKFAVRIMVWLARGRARNMVGRLPIGRAQFAQRGSSCVEARLKIFSIALTTMNAPV
jgi:hypothetical protein